MNLTIRKIKKTNFISLYQKLLSNEIESKKEYLALLSIAIIMLNSSDYNVQRLGYRIIIIYTNQSEDYAPLYEIAINKGLYPIVKYIDQNLLSEDNKNIFTELNNSYLEIFKSGDVYFSKEQYCLNSYYSKNQNNSISVVAPTSYGKTELIIKTIKECPNKNICVITPTKSLLTQTRNRILKSKIEWVNKVIIHPDMYNKNDNCCVAVLTQERLFRLLKNYPRLYFDYVIIDEAHNILESSKRDEMLASTIIVLNKRNDKTAFKFLTPFLNDINNLKVRYTTYNLSEYTIQEYVKSEKVFLYDIRSNSGLSLYDQFLDKWINIKEESSNQTSIQFIIKHSLDKNIIYFNKPTDIEQYAREMIFNMPDLKLGNELEKAINHISKYINPEYTLVKCLKKGIIYHHGSVPDAIRSYIEYLYTKLPEIKYVITSSTLLEGVNIPASRLFIMDNRKGSSNLSSSAFKNLIGRICRFSDIFDNQTGSLSKLEPEIYLVFDKYYSKRTNIKKFVSNVMKIDRNEEDKLKNVLLLNTTINDDNSLELNKAKEFLENYEEGSIKDYTERHTKTQIGKFCILNNITEIDIFNCEEELQSNVSNYRELNGKITDSDELLNAIYEIFLSYVIDNPNNRSILRFNHEATRNYYKMFLSWKLQNYPYSEMIKLIVRYWRLLIQQKNNTVVYVGKWGDISLFDNGKSTYTDIRNKDLTQLINLSIVRIKEEQDFLDNTIMKFVEVLNDIDLIEQKLYSNLKYGTNNPIEMILIKNGISLSLARLVIEKYYNYISCNLELETIQFNEELIHQMRENNENSILIFEAQNNLF